MHKGFVSGIWLILSWGLFVSFALKGWDFAVFALVVSHLFLGVFYLFDHPRRELLLAFFAAVFGALLDSLLNQGNILIFFRNLPGIWVAPMWIFGMWLGFTVNAPYALSLLKGRYLILACVGALLGSTTYSIAVHFELLLFHSQFWMTFFILASMWAFIFPFYLYLHQKFTT